MTLTRVATTLARPFSTDQAQMPQLCLGTIQSDDAAIEARLLSPISYVELRAPRVVCFDRPLEVEISCSDRVIAASVFARFISSHATLSLEIHANGQYPVKCVVPVSARPSGGGCIARALIRTEAWAKSESVTVVSLALADHLLPCNGLPATLRVGYTHALAPAGAVHEAASCGDVPALLAALDAGGSTEERDEVRKTTENGRQHAGCESSTSTHP